MEVNFQVNPAYAHLINSDKRFMVLRGGSGCFVAGTKIVKRIDNSIDGEARDIDKIKVGDDVLSYNFVLQVAQMRKVTATHTRKAECVKIKLKNGLFIECTLDHKFFDGESFVTISEMIEQWKTKSGK